MNAFECDYECVESERRGKKTINNQPKKMHNNSIHITLFTKKYSKMREVCVLLL